jgi:hypothetical protein
VKVAMRALRVRRLTVNEFGKTVVEYVSKRDASLYPKAFVKPLGAEVILHPLAPPPWDRRYPNVTWAEGEDGGSV